MSKTYIIIITFTNLLEIVYTLYIINTMFPRSFVIAHQVLDKS